MTSYPPPGQPPGPPPPPPGSYGPPPGTGGRATFDPKSVNPLDWGILASGVLSLIFSFFKYYSYKADLNKIADALHVPRQSVQAVCANPGAVPGVGRSQVDAACNGVDKSAWTGFFGWFGVLLALIGSALVALAIYAPQVKLPLAARLGALAAFALAVISTLIALPVVPDYNGADVSQLAGTGLSYDDVVDESHGFSYWIVLILIVIGMVLTFLRFQQTGGQLTIARGSTGGTAAARPPQPGYGGPPAPAPPGYPQAGSPPAGYQAPPGYQPPAPQPQPPAGGAPQPGYGAPPPPPPGPSSAPPPPSYPPPQ